MIQLEYEKNKNIIHATRSGEVSIDQLLDYVCRIDQEYSSYKALYILDDVTASKSVLDPPYDFSDILKEINLRIDKYESIALAVYVEDPTDTAFSFLFDALFSQIDKFQFQTFSTKNSAFEWLAEQQSLNNY